MLNTLLLRKCTEKGSNLYVFDDDWSGPKHFLNDDSNALGYYPYVPFDDLDQQISTSTTTFESRLKSKSCYAFARYIKKKSLTKRGTGASKFAQCSFSDMIRQHSHIFFYYSLRE